MSGKHFTNTSGVRVDQNGGVPARKHRLTPLGARFMIGSRARVVCQCDCGAVVVVKCGDITSEDTRSCGCRRRERVIERNTKHDMAHSAEHRAWCHMKSRCTNRSAKDYARYGGRGIAVCDRWLNSFADFLADMGPKPTSQHSIDRVNNNGNYEPGNCRWASKVEQSNNTRGNHIVIINGVSRTIAEWSRISSVNSKTICMRLRRGWSNEESVFKTVKRRNGVLAVVSHAGFP